MTINSGFRVHTRSSYVLVRLLMTSYDLTITSGSKMAAILDPPSWILVFFQNL